LGILRDENSMPEALSDDLRGRIVDAYVRGEGSQRKAAKRFTVSFEYVRKVCRQWRQTGRKERVEQRRHGPMGRMNDAVGDRLRGWLGRQPDRTLADLGPVNTTGIDGVASENRARLGRARRLWRAHSRERERRMARFAPQPEGTGPIFPISLSLVASRHPVCVTNRENRPRRHHPSSVNRP